MCLYIVTCCLSIKFFVCFFVVFFSLIPGTHPHSGGECQMRRDHIKLHLHNLHTWSPSWLYVPSLLGGGKGGGKGGDISWCACIVKKRQTNKLETLIPPMKTLLGALYLIINSHWCRCRWGCCAHTGWTIQLPSLLGETNTKFCNTILTVCIPTTIKHMFTVWRKKQRLFSGH